MTVESALSVDRLTVHYGGMRALSEVCLDIAPRAVHALIGPNGAGKTTLLNAVSRLVPTSGGSVRIGGADVTGAVPHALAALGVARTFQAAVLAGEMTAVENVMAGLYSRRTATVAQELLGLPAARRSRRRIEEQARAALSDLGLAEVADRPAGELSYGTQKLVDVARAWAGRPALLMLDEPTAGLDDREIDDVSAFVRLASADTAILLIAHHIEFVMAVADRITVLDYGVVIADGPPDEVRRDRRVIETYTGIGG